MTSIGSGGLLGAVILLALAAVPLPSTDAGTQLPQTPATSLPSLGTGEDISFPQCSARSHTGLPAQFPFAIVGVNGGTASRLNPCFQSEYNSALLLAGTTEQPHASVYVNTGNPALAASWWPSENSTKSGTQITNPDGECAHAAGAACAYVYGYSMAQADYRYVRRSVTLIPHLWWLDVETTNSWATDVTANGASLSGMVDYFQSKNLAVGIYSTSYQWHRIAGVTVLSSNLAELPSWLAGGSPRGAAVDCEKPPLTPGGWVAMVQYVSTLDNDVSCHLFRSPRASIATSGSPVVGSFLTADTGQWSESADYSYQWMRDGDPIKDATGEIYTAAASDLGQDLSVTVTGKAPGYSTASRTSASVLVLGQLSPKPAGIEGQFVSGSALSAVTKPWGPSPVSLYFDWYRGSKLVEAGTSARTYILSGADVGQQITLRISGSRPGYATISETAATPVIDPQVDN